MPAPAVKTKTVRVTPLMGLLMRYGPLFGLALVVVLACFMYGNVFGGEIAGDDLTFHLAESNRMADCIHLRDWDMWNPSANAGFASAYYYQALPQLAPAALSVITGASVLFWFQVCVFLPLVLAPVAAYKALRVVGTSGWHALGGAFAIVVSASNNRWGFGADGTFSVGLYTQTWALAAFPLALGYAIRWVRDGGSLAPAIAWSGVVAVCHPFAGIAVGLAVTAGAAAVIAWAPIATALDAARGGAIERIRSFTKRLRDPDAPAEPRLRVGAAAIRIPVFGMLLLAAIASVWMPLIFDYAGFGGFPHRVWDEVGPGFVRLWDWYTSGQLLDCNKFDHRMRVLTLLLPFALVFGRDRSLAWLWAGAAVFVVLLGLGPNLPRSTGDDLFPMVRFLGPLQICVSLAIGVGAVSIGLALWRWATTLGDTWELPAQAVVAGLATAAIVSLAIPSVHIAQFRARNVTEYDYIHREELRDVAHRLAALPEGRKQDQVGNHWANQLPYVDERINAGIQMGGGGLQSSPNYDFFWNYNGDPTRIAWVFDAPYELLVNNDDNAAETEDAEIVIRTEHFIVKRLAAPGLVSPVEIVSPPLPQGRRPARQAAIEWMKTEDALADKLRPYDVMPGPSGPPDGQVLDARHQDSPGDEPDIVAKVHAGKPTTFVVRESWHPRWHGFIDGREAPLRRVTPDFFAIDVPSGDHTLTFRFDRPWWVWASWLMLILVPLAGWKLGPRLKKLAEPPSVDEIEKVF